ncbi:hypothetical protein HN748_03815 [Candidatus Peregrinibacteria bacterium]|jgi:hypothetical protein|nr:hypothetical protein [Candidatus Peregrinibacteria bacterium]MBT7484066.1 hypothetical protein [Candidatus Peregrinibacteria bacterium]MBT7703336.1 hypothetical protein [Candidatus Peregrinibacteria bacterium]
MDVSSGTSAPTGPQGPEVLITEALEPLPNSALAVIVGELLLSEAGLTKEPGLTRQEQIQLNAAQRAELEPVLKDRAFRHVKEVIKAAIGSDSELHSCWWDEQRGAYVVSALIDPEKSSLINPEQFNPTSLQYISQRQTHNRQACFAIPLSAFLPLSGEARPSTSITKLEQRAAKFEGRELGAAILERAARREQLLAEEEALLELGKGLIFRKVEELARDANSNTVSRLDESHLDPEQVRIIITIPAEREEGSAGPHVIANVLRALLPSCCQITNKAEGIEVVAPIAEMLNNSDVEN